METIWHFSPKLNYTAHLFLLPSQSQTEKTISEIKIQNSWWGALWGGGINYAPFYSSHFFFRTGFSFYHLFLDLNVSAAADEEINVDSSLSNFCLETALGNIHYFNPRFFWKWQLGSFFPLLTSPPAMTHSEGISNEVKEKLKTGLDNISHFGWMPYGTISFGFLWSTPKIINGRKTFPNHHNPYIKN